MSNRVTGWAELRLGDVCRLRAGSGFKTELQGRSVGDYPFIKQSDMSLPMNGRFIIEAANWVNEGDLKLLKARPHPAGTVVFGKIGEGLKRNRFRVLTRPTIIDNNMMGATPTAEVVSDFFAYLIGQVDMGALSEGSALPYLRTEDLARVPILVPPLAEQRAIAGVLGALDDKIECNRRLVLVLEQLGRSELAFALAGPDGEAWEYAWPEMQLGEALSLIETGDRPKGGVGEIASGIPSIGAESIVAPGVFDFGKTKYVSEEYFLEMRRGVLQSGDVLLYKDGGTPGNFIPKVSMCQDGFPYAVAAINSHVYRLRVQAPYSQAFLYFWLSSQRLLDEMWLRGTGAAIPSLNSTNVKGLPFPQIPASRLEQVVPLVDELMSYLHKAAREQRTLEQLRDALLPELLSGRLRVRDVECVLEEAL